ncbi:CHAT domain-containing protein [Bipolaris maydis]|nr:CHAT domain-containing protein [Bipolaris maydis]
MDIFNSTLLESFDVLFTALSPQDTRSRSTLCGHYAMLKVALFERSGRIEDLDDAITKGKLSIDDTLGDDRVLHIQLNNLANMLEDAIHLSRRARPSTLSNLGNKLSRLYKETGNLQTLDEAIDFARQAMDMQNLMNKLALRSEYSRRPEDLDEGLQVARRLQLDALQCLYVLEEATRIARRVRIATTDRSPHFAARLHNLANCLYRRSEYFAEKDDVEEAALRQTPYNHKSLGGLMHGLGQILQLRFHISGDTNDLDEAMQLMREALEGTQQDCTDFSEISTDLVAILQLRYMRLRDGKDLEEAIVVARKAIEILPQGYRNFATMLSNLSDLLGSKFEREKDIELLDEAIQIQQRAIGLAPKGYPHTGVLLNRLGKQLRYRYECTKDSQDLDQAIQAAREALKATRETHHSYSTVLKDLGLILLYGYGRSEELKDLKEVIHVLQRVWSCKNGSPFVRIIACNLLVHLLHLDHDYDRAFDLAVEAINMLPYVHKRSLNLQDQQYVVSHFFGLSPIACSIALHKGEGPDTALELLERGRGLILGLLMEDRRNIQALEVAHPKLYVRYESLRIETNKPTEGYSNCLERNEALSSQMSDMEKLDECVQEIRKLPGFDKFHERSTVKQMQDCASDGDIIVVNITQLRSDAIVVTARGTRTISFPKLSTDDVRSWMDQDLTTTSMNDKKAGQKNKIYRQFLSWLWQDCVKPIMEELHYDAKASIDSLPRIWWIGTGFANNFPFHAAGDSSGNVGQYAISSYTPTIRALRYARERSVATAPSSGIQKALIVTMPDTPGMNKLPRSIVEAQDITAVIETVVDVEVIERPSVATTLSKLQGCSIAHFACHGLSDEQSPGASGLILQREDKESSTPRQDMLTTQMISLLELSQAEIAFLSACYTADGRADLLSDEMLHVVSGFQTAGFRHVIGCLWPSKDRVCSAIAKAFYAELYRDGVKGRNKDKAVAIALHKAVQRVRDSEELHKRPLSWAQYVHFGV